MRERLEREVSAERTDNLTAIGLALARSRHPASLGLIEVVLSQCEILDVHLGVLRALPRNVAASRAVSKSVRLQPNPGLRCTLITNAARLLGSASDFEVEQEIHACAVGDRRSQVRRSAVTALGTGPRALEFQVQLAEIFATEAVLDVRLAALRSYSNSGPTAVEFLAEVASQESEPLKVRYAALLGLGHVGTVEAFRAANDLARSERNPDLQTLAAAISRQLGERLPGSTSPREQ